MLTQIKFIFRLSTGIAAAIAANPVPTVWKWLYTLGGPGLILLGLLDSSVIPIPGSMDVLTIVLAARDKSSWLFFAFMATAGSVIGAYVTYRLARKNGKDALEKKLSKKKIKRVSEAFERWGFGAIAIPALLPPPMPMVPFVVVAGAMQYPRNKFLGAMVLGRAIRYSLLAYLGAHYGGPILGLIMKRGRVVALVAIGIAIALGIGFLLAWRSRQRK